ncbi:MFS transporter [Streptomyces sp. NBC_01304]|uniref:MFS transporter n=1 Tax=Streptomyces sp. NBC_01304 TaxID=2903818 RepID=UPI002E0EF79E|nr:MFS transporter [Streptomyces sp. NBC_01304]
MALQLPLRSAETPARTARSVIATLLAASLVVKAAGFGWDFLGYYVASGTGHGTTAAGAALTTFGVGWCLGLAGAGALTDRLGQRTALIALMILSAVACFALALTTSLPALLAVSLLLGVTMEAHRPAVSAAINDTLHADAARTRAQGWLYFCSNVGIAICGAVGGYAAHHHGYQALFVINGIVCLAFAVVARRVLGPHRPAKAQTTVTYRQVFADAALRWMAVVAVFSMICAWGLVSVMPLLMNDDSLPATSYGVAMVCNTVGVLALTPVVMRLLVGDGDTIKFPLVPVLVTGAGILGVGITVAALQHTLAGYCLAALIIVPGEVCFSVAAGAYISTSVPTGATGRYQAVISSATALASLPPLGIALALEAGGRPLVAVILALCALTAVAACRPLGRALAAAQLHSKPTTTRELLEQP